MKLDIDAFAQDFAVDAFTDRGRTVESMFPEIRPHLLAGLGVLDVGCASGAVTIDAARSVRPSGRVVGADPVEEMVIRARLIADEEGIDNVEFMIGNAEALPFPDNEFDLVYSTNTFGYIMDWSKAVAEMKRVAKVGGRVAVRVSEWGSLVMHPRCSAAERVLAAYANFPVNEGFYFNPCKGRTLYSEFNEAGLDAVEVTATTWCTYNRGQDSFSPDAVGIFIAGEMMQPVREYLIENGLLNEQTVAEAARELEQWQNHPGAFMAVGGVAVVGEV